MKSRVVIAAMMAVLGAMITPAVSAEDDPLPSWTDGGPKTAIIRFVDRVRTRGGPDWVPADDRIAVFDNDGTLWSEQPYYNQAAFAFDRIKALAAEHPEWKDKPPFRAVLGGDIKAVMAGSPRERLELIAATHAGMTTEVFERIVREWTATARHPRFKRPYTDLVYRPMRELLDYLRSAGFRTFIVSGGGVEFIRPWAERAYGIRPEQIVGSTIKMKYETRDGQPALVRLAELEFIDDFEGKPVGIERHIGRRPILAFGNSDGDEAMLRWTTAGPGPRLGLILHHTDAEREWAYDRLSAVGRLDRALDEAPARGWVVVDMKADWRKVFAFDE
jgi:phosphoglycolate phosphatase-like HAD superfamily hydrolase